MDDKILDVRNRMCTVDDKMGKPLVHGAGLVIEMK